MDKKTCWNCQGKGHTDRTVVIGSMVTIMHDTCYTCHGKGYLDK